MTCPPLETVAAWVLDELPGADAEAFEAHYFGCAACFERAQRLQALSHLLASFPAFVLTPQRRQRLEQQAPAIATVHVRPGEQATIHLDERAPLALWVLHCDLHGVARVDLEAVGPTGEQYFAVPDVPFDAERGQVVMPCQLHYRAMQVPPLFHARLSSVEAQGSRPLGEYILNHDFESL